MKLIRGNIWDSGADAICVTTNGIIKHNGRAVMGRGIALQAANRYPQLALALAKAIRDNGNHVHRFEENDCAIITFPTKNHWRDPSSIELIAQSAHELVYISQTFNRVALPYPGCANGQLDIFDVVQVIKPILSDDKFEIWDYKVKS